MYMYRDVKIILLSSAQQNGRESSLLDVGKKIASPRSSSSLQPRPESNYSRGMYNVACSNLNSSCYDVTCSNLNSSFYGVTCSNLNSSFYGVTCSNLNSSFYGVCSVYMLCISCISSVRVSFHEILCEISILLPCTCMHVYAHVCCVVCMLAITRCGSMSMYMYL